MHHHVDPVNCNRDQKEIIRPFLVAHGSAKRSLSHGRHWIEKLHNKIIAGDRSKFKIITDIRYDDYENDEADWLQRELGGVLVHVSQYKISACVDDSIMRMFLKPANAEEARNDPKLKEKSNFNNREIKRKIKEASGDCWWIEQWCHASLYYYTKKKNR